MTINTINVGAAPNDGNGDPARTAFGIHNSNFTDTANSAAALIQTSEGDDTAGRVLTTDRLSEAVINSEGRYWKYPDGRLECLLSIATGAVDQAAGALFVTTPITVDTPFAFIDSSYQVSVNDSDSQNLWGAGHAVSNTSIKFSIFFTSSGAGARTAIIALSGRWK